MKIPQSRSPFTIYMYMNIIIIEIVGSYISNCNKNVKRIVKIKFLLGKFKFLIHFNVNFDLIFFITGISTN